MAIPRRSAPTRERLVAAARQLFGETGYAGTSTRAIASRAGCNVSLIKHYFGNKDGLLRAVLIEGVTTVGDELRALDASPEPATARIERFIGFMVEHFDRSGDLMRIVDRQLLQKKEPILEEARAIARTNMDLLAAILSDLRREHRLRRLDPRMAAVLLMGMIKFYFAAYPLTSRLVGRRSPAVLASLKRHVRQVFLEGVLR
ncbi:MAG: TetR family transcriptional regulator [Acidobacteriota bacterium]